MSIAREGPHSISIDMTSQLDRTLQVFEDDPELHLQEYDSPGTPDMELEEDSVLSAKPTVAHCVNYYSNLVGELNYHVRTTSWRPDLHNSLSRLSRYLQDTPLMAGKLLVRTLGYHVKNFKTRKWKLRLRATTSFGRYVYSLSR